MILFEKENSWKRYGEVALTPSFMLYLDYDLPDHFYCLSFHFLAWKVAITFKR